MATMVKEKRREKKKSKEKHTVKKDAALPSLINDVSLEVRQSSTQALTLHTEGGEDLKVELTQTVDDEHSETIEEAVNIEERVINVIKKDKDINHDLGNNSELPVLNENQDSNNDNSNSVNIENACSNSKKSSDANNVITNTVHSECNTNNTVIPSLDNTENDSKLYGSLEEELKSLEIIEQDMVPSAPVLEQSVSVAPVFHPVLEHKNEEIIKPKTQCMSLEEAIRVYGGKEIAEVKAMSEREEAFVESGPVSGAEHPLVDLLSNFRLSLTAVERERGNISCNLIEEEKARSKLWKIQKRSVSVSETCRCGANVDFKAVFDHAELLKGKLPAARMRLQVILRDVQESYCHHQHAALLAYCQIEDLVSETVQSSKNSIREALSLVLQALRLSDGATEAYPHALRRWAGALAAALVDERDLSQLLFLLHHLFRQTRSVRWASRIVRMGVTDTYSAARTIAVLDLLLARPGLETAVECTEELEAWEEVDRRGDAGAVGEGRLRERDLCALLAALPLHALFARLTLFARADIRSGSPLEWGDASGGHGMLKCCCGVRALLDVCARALHAHPAYGRLHDTLRRLACHLLHALAALHMHSSPLYMTDLEERIIAELEACFVAGFGLGGQLERLPAGLLAPATAWDYCSTFMTGLHDTKPCRIEALCIDAPVLTCDMRVRIITQAAVDRPADHDLARSVLEFLIQTGTKRKPATCACAAAARDALAHVLAAHRYLHTAAFDLVADLYQAEPVEPTLVACLCPGEWRPSPGEVRSVLDEWGRRCSPLLQHLLLQLDCTPHQGLSLETQLSVGSWLCEWAAGAAGRAGSEPGWCWAALRRLRVHRSQWRLPLDAPPPDEPRDMFSTAYALLSSSWGHCVPLACGPGAEALCRLAAVRPVEALHCLDPIMRVMALSPESVSYTPKFGETLSILLNAGPSLVQRALGRARPAPADTLRQLLLDQLHQLDQPDDDRAGQRAALLAAWLHALWAPALPPAARAALDAAVRAAHLWSTLDAHVAALLQEENSKEYIADAIRNASTAPLLCEATLRALHAHEVRTQTHPRVLDALWRQRAAAQRIHVDNALKQIGAFVTGEELVVHRSAAAALVVPPQHPAHLTLWRLFFHIYLQRPPCRPQESTPPIGPLFFSGIVKSRVLSQLKRRLQDTAAYHQRQAEVLQTSSGDGPARPPRREKPSPPADTDIFPSLSIGEFADDRTDSGSDEDGDEAAPDVAGEATRENGPRDTADMICYHSAAEKLSREYGWWLEEGEAARAAPHHADIARYIPDQAMDAAWRSSLPRPPSPEPPPSPPPRPHRSTFPHATSLQSHYDRAVEELLAVKDNSHRRKRRTSVKSLLRDVNVQDARALLARVDTLLADVQTLAQDWSSEVRYITKLDAQLWDLVGALRVRRPLPPVSKSCAQGCKPTTVRIPEDEWCVSTGAERGIQENRRSAHAALRRLARARPDAAHTAATLLCVARRIRNVEEAVRVAERAARCADAVEDCVLAKQALDALITELAERWLCAEGGRCAALVRAWGGGGRARQALCGALLAPRRLPPAHYPAVYTALLSAPLPPHVTFSYLSKFEMSRWAEGAEPGQRREVLEALVAAAQAAGAGDTDQNQVLVELLGVHACAVVTSQELCAHVSACARACVSRRLPPAFCASVARSADTHSAHVTFDKLGHLQRELGAVWWEARTSAAVTSSYAPYAEHAAQLLRALQRAFVSAAVGISYEPAAVAEYAWSAIRESWGPWVTPHPSPPLLPSTGEDEAYTGMLTRFVETIAQVMEQCPGSEEALLRQVWRWAVQTYLGVAGAGPGAGQEGRVQLSALLAGLLQLPWAHQWFHVDCLQLALQAVGAGDKELSAWCARTWRGTAAAAWVRGAAPDTLAPALAALLALFTCPHAHHAPQTLLEACDLPWSRLPAAALDEGLERFFMEHYNTTMPYHDAPQFIIVLAASELRAPATACASGRDKRARGVSQWVRAAAAPALAAHVPAHSHALLAVITALAPYLDRSAGELEELLARAVVIMCMDAAAAALPVWERWVRTCGARLRAACASAAGSLTHPDYFAALADAVARAHLADSEGTGWPELSARWAACAWVGSGALAARGALHAAYGALLADARDVRRLRPVLHALASSDIKFEDEAIIAVWICVACRCAVGGATAGAESDEEAECRAQARSLLTRWGVEPRRTLLQVVALQAAPSAPTPQHRLLCKLAQCIIERDEAAARAYEAACSTLPAAGADAAGWGREPRAARLPRLAARLYPDRHLYFREELQLAPDTT